MPGGHQTEWPRQTPEGLLVALHRLEDVDPPPLEGVAVCACPMPSGLSIVDDPGLRYGPPTRRCPPAPDPRPPSFLACGFAPGVPARGGFLCGDPAHGFLSAIGYSYCGDRGDLLGAAPSGRGVQAISGTRGHRTCCVPGRCQQSSGGLCSSRTVRRRIYCSPPTPPQETALRYERTAHHSASTVRGTRTPKPRSTDESLSSPAKSALAAAIA